MKQELINQCTTNVLTWPEAFMNVGVAWAIALGFVFLIKVIIE